MTEKVRVRVRTDFNPMKYGKLTALSVAVPACIVIVSLVSGVKLTTECSCVPFLRGAARSCCAGGETEFGAGLTLVSYDWEG